MFTLVDSQGATEAAPSLGYADVIADITETGTTLRENRLKIVSGTTILRSQACLIAGRHSLRKDASKLMPVQTILELMHIVDGGDAPSAVGSSTTWFAVSLIIVADRVLDGVSYLRSLGSTGIVVLPIQYAFGEYSDSYRQLFQAIERDI